MTQQTFSEIIEEEVAEAIEIAESELGHDIREGYLNASQEKRKNATAILMEIRVLQDSAEEDVEDKSLEIFAKVLKLETTLGLC